MKKTFFLLLILNFSFLIGVANTQWWVSGGNLLWPYGDVTVSKDLYVTGSIINTNYNRYESNTASYIYIALLTQSGDDAPTAIIIENTFPDTVIWSRTSPGIYKATLPGAFSLPTTISFIYPNRVMSIDEWCFFNIYYTDFNTLSVTTIMVDFTEPNLGYADGILNYTAVEIRVYH
jgi:hypothetical protein